MYNGPPPRPYYMVSCRGCGKWGSSIDEFLSPYTGRCAICEERANARVTMMAVQNGLISRKEATERQGRDVADVVRDVHADREARRALFPLNRLDPEAPGIPGRTCYRCKCARVGDYCPRCGEEWRRVGWFERWFGRSSPPLSLQPPRVSLKLDARGTIWRQIWTAHRGWSRPHVVLPAVSESSRPPDERPSKSDFQMRHDRAGLLYRWDLYKGDGVLPPEAEV